MKVLYLCLLLLSFSLSWAQDISLDAFFSDLEIAVIEQLLERAQENDIALLQAQATLAGLERDLSFASRLEDALSVSAGVGLNGNFYDQASARYEISVSLDVIRLLEGQEDQSSLLTVAVENARRQLRLRVVNDFVGYKISREAARAAALALESAETNFRVVEARLEVGDATISDALSAQNAVGSAAITLLQANGDIIQALEQLATTIGTEPEEARMLVMGAFVPAAEPAASPPTE